MSTGTLSHRYTHSRMEEFATDPPFALLSGITQTLERLLVEKSNEAKFHASTRIESMVRSFRARADKQNDSPQMLYLNDASRETPQGRRENLEPDLSRSSHIRASSIDEIMQTIDKDFLKNASPSHRIGGLLGIASIAVGLEKEVSDHLDRIIPLIIVCCSDPEAKVRFRASEALYNIAKIAREDILLHFNEVFDGLCKLYADVDSEVKNAAAYLDRLLKDIVRETSNFNLAQFVPFLARRAKVLNPFVRQFVISWITLLINAPDINFIMFIPFFLEALLGMLTDTNRAIRYAADCCLAELLGSLKKNSDRISEDILNEIAEIVSGCSGSSEALCRFTALAWLRELVKEDFKRDFLKGLYPTLVDIVLSHVADTEEEICKIAYETHKELLKKLAASDSEEKFDVEVVVPPLLSKLKSSEGKLRVASLEWFAVLIFKREEKMTAYLTELFALIIPNSTSNSTELKVASLTVLAMISSTYSDFFLYPIVATEIVDIFKKNTHLLKERGRVIVQIICRYLKVELLFAALADTLIDEKDEEICHQLVPVFNWVLLTTQEAENLRVILRIQSHHALFLKLLVPWFHNPVSALSLCLWVQEYALAYELLCNLSTLNLSVNFLVQLDQLINLLETPVFAYLRLQLLDSKNFPYLAKTMMGLLMLMPQNETYQILANRLSVMQYGLLLSCQVGIEPYDMCAIPLKGMKAETEGIPAITDSQGINANERHELILQFRTTIQRHQEFISQIDQGNSLDWEGVLEGMKVKCDFRAIVPENENLPLENNVSKTR